MNNRGMTLVELLIALVIVVLVLAAAFMSFNRLFQSFKSQTKVSESHLSSLIGLELLRKDIEMAGFGLPYNCSGISFNEAVNAPASNYNDVSNASNVRAFVLGNNAGPNSSDYLVIRSAFNPYDDETTKWAYFIGNDTASGSPCPIPITAGGASSFSSNTNVVVVDGEESLKDIQQNSGNWKFHMASSGGLNVCPDNLTANHFYLVYGVESDNDTNPDMRAPFNRVDYYLSAPSGGMPVKCATNTYEFYRAQFNHSDGGFNPQPVLDCVKDLQVSFATYDNSTGTTSWGAPPSSAYNQKVKVKEVRVFILYQEGQKERGVVTTSSIVLGDGDTGTLKTFTPSGDDAHYRWRVKELGFQPMNLGR